MVGQTTDLEAETAEQRIKRSNVAVAAVWQQKLATQAAKKAADEQAQKAAALAALDGKAVRIDGLPHPEYNGLYVHDSMVEGWPVLKNPHGKFYIKHPNGYVSGLHPAVERELRTGAGGKRKKLYSARFPTAFEHYHRPNPDKATQPWLWRSSEDAELETHNVTVTLVSE